MQYDRVNSGRESTTAGGRGREGCVGAQCPSVVVETVEDGGGRSEETAPQPALLTHVWLWAPAQKTSQRPLRRQRRLRGLLIVCDDSSLSVGRTCQLQDSEC